MLGKRVWLTGVSNAMQATMLGHSGASLSGRVLTNSIRASAASRPPILPTVPSDKGSQAHRAAYLCPHRTRLALPAPPPMPFATSRRTVRSVSQSANLVTAAFYAEVLSLKYI